jgi:hypothetical protein
MRSLNQVFHGIAFALPRRAVLAAIAAGLALFAVSPQGEAGTITWGSAQTIAGDTDVVTTGSTVYAYNFGTTSVASTTVNGVAFAPFGVPAGVIQTVTVGDLTITENPYYLFAYDTFGSSTTPYSSLSASYKTLLNSAAWAGLADSITVTLGGLQPGGQYVVQWWTSDAALNFGSRITATSGNSVTLDSNTTGTVGGVGQFAVGTFTATGTSQTFTLAGSTSSGFLNDFPILSGLQLRTQAGPGPTPVPEIAAASAGTALSLVAAAFAAVERRRRRVTVVARRG